MTKPTCDQLVLVWKDPQSKRNYSVGAITRNSGGFVFEYGFEYELARKNANWELLKAFPDEKTYRSDSLFTAFASRLPDPKRRGIKKILEKYGLSEYDGFDLLRASSGRLPIDSYEFIDPIFPEDETVIRRFFLSGIGYKSGCGGKDCSKLPKLDKGDMLTLVPEPDNEHDRFAVAVCKGEQPLGYVPRYFSEQIAKRLNVKMSYQCLVVEASMGNDCSNCIYVELTMPKPEIVEE